MYKSNFTENHLMNASTACSAGVPTKIGEYKVEAGEIVGLGYKDGGQDSALGRIYVSLKDSSSADINGIFRLQISSAQDIPLAVLYEARTEELRSGENDITKRLPFNESELNARVTEDKKIQAFFIADTTKTVDRSKSKMVLSISRTLV